MKMPESVNVIKRAILFTNLSLSSKPSKPNPSRPQLFRALSATSTLRSTESSRCGSAKPQRFSLPFLRRYGVVYVANTTQKQIGIFFCLECSKWTFAWNLQNSTYSWKFNKNDIRSNLAKEKNKQYLKTYIIHIIHRQSINLRKTIKCFVGTNRQHSLRFDPTDLNLPMVPHTNF